MKSLTGIVVTMVLIAVLSGAALAVPRLQTYIAGSNYYNFYRQEYDSWVTGNSNFDVKVVGYWQPAALNGGGFASGPASAAYDYLDTWLMVNVPRNQSGTIWINGVEMTGFGSYGSTVPAGIDARPSLRNHMPAGIGLFNFASLGRIDNDQINAYEYSHGSIGNPGWGDEILVNVVVSGYSWVHFDAVGMDALGRTFANPFSHDASYYSTPEPGTLSLLGLGLLGMVPLLRRKKE